MSTQTPVCGNVLIGNYVVNDVVGFGSHTLYGQFTANADDTPTAIWMNLTASVGATVTLAIFDDNTGQPGKILAFGISSNSCTYGGCWSRFPIAGSPFLSSGTAYWLAVYMVNGAVGYDHSGGIYLTKGGTLINADFVPGGTSSSTGRLCLYADPCGDAVHFPTVTPILTSTPIGSGI
jgi:hypothetical protein